MSGDNIYAAVSHGEYYREKANEDNWSPSPWFPNQEMPDSVDLNDSKWLVLRVADNGEIEGAEPVMIKSKMLTMNPALNGNVFVVYDNEILGLDAQLMTPELTKWTINS